MKRSILLFSSILISSLSFAQFANDMKIKLSADNSIIPSGSTVDIYVEPNSTDSHIFKIENKGAAAYSVNVTKQYFNSTDGVGVKLAGTKSYFCWTQCYDENIYASTPTSIAPNGNYPFVGDFEPGVLSSGFQTNLYTFFVPNSSDSIYLFLRYNLTPAGINANTSVTKNEISGAYPNPAGTYTTFSYSTKNASNSKLEVFDMIGVMVKEINLDETKGKVLLNTSEMENGVYFYCLVVDNKAIASKKLVVTH
jgi:hypothetical protein